MGYRIAVENGETTGMARQWIGRKLQSDGKTSATLSISFMILSTSSMLVPCTGYSVGRPVSYSVGLIANDIAYCYVWFRRMDWLNATGLFILKHLAKIFLQRIARQNSNIISFCFWGSSVANSKMYNVADLKKWNYIYLPKRRFYFDNRQA